MGLVANEADFSGSDVTIGRALRYQIGNDLQLAKGRLSHQLLTICVVS
jgi:hypothetical protein